MANDELRALLVKLGLKSSVSLFCLRRTFLFTVFSGQEMLLKDFSRSQQKMSTNISGLYQVILCVSLNHKRN